MATLILILGAVILILNALGGSGILPEILSQLALLLAAILALVREFLQRFFPSRLTGLVAKILR